MKEISVRHTDTPVGWGAFLWGVLFTFLAAPIISTLLIDIPLGIYKSSHPGSMLWPASAQETIQTSFITLFQLAIAGFFLYKYKPMKKLIKSTLSFKPILIMETYLYILLSFLITFIAGMGIDYAFPSATKDQASTLSLTDVWSMPWALIAITFFSTALLIPIYEEFIFRGVILTFFCSKYSFPVSCILSSILFGAAHFYSIGIMCSAFIGGILMSMLYKKTHSIIPCILFHMLNNALSLILMR